VQTLPLTLNCLTSNFIGLLERCLRERVKPLFQVSGVRTVYEKTAICGNRQEADRNKVDQQACFDF
jgi:hypothetical protein